MSTQKFHVLLFGSGITWRCGIPDDKYLVKIGDTDFERLSDSDDCERLSSLLQWLSQSICHKVAGSDVNWQEETIFFVLKSDVNQPPWSAVLTVFDVWRQEQVVVTFKLSQ